MSFCIPGGPLFGQPSVVAKNVTINNGATGFMGSLFEGMAYGMGATSNIGMCGGCYPGVGLTGLGMPMGYPMMSQLTMPSLINPMATLNNNAVTQQSQTQTNADTQLSNLKTLFPKHTVVADGDGKYTLRTSDGKIYSGTYEQIKSDMNEAIKNAPKAQGDGSSESA